MLVLPIKKKWFDMILSGEKKEEYREITPYWTTRLINHLPLWESGFVKFRSGCGKNRPTIICRVVLSKDDRGERRVKEEWGAEPNKKYYILEIREVRKVQNYEN